MTSHDTRKLANENSWRNGNFDSDVTRRNETSQWKSVTKIINSWWISRFSQSFLSVPFGAGRLGVRLSAESYQDLVNWHISLLTRRTVCGRAAGNTNTKPSEMKPEIVETQSWRYKTIAVTKRQRQTTISKKSPSSGHCLSSDKSSHCRT